MYQVQKRDGKVVDFNISKIAGAIRLAFDAQDKQSHPSVIDFLALKVTADFESKIKEGLISVEDIQDSVEAVLVQGGYADVAKAYIIYRRQHEQLRNVKSSILD
ncbi:MAG: ribonucleoside triphosphate reductase, partial [Lentisphaeria bacterium]|nr:ribonucleoside triphosphate reductase [Lentisphaeria bacterium]